MLTLFTGHIKKWLTTAGVDRFRVPIVETLKGLTDDELTEAAEAYALLGVLLDEERVFRWGSVPYTPVAEGGDSSERDTARNG